MSKLLEGGGDSERFADTAIPGAGLGESRSENERKATRRYQLQQSGLVVLLIFIGSQVASIIFGLVDPGRFAYLVQGNVVTGLETIPLTGIVTLGVGVLMIAGEFDLSVGANFAFSSMVMAQLAGEGMSPFAAGAIALAVGCGIGLINGLVTVLCRIPSFIATLGTMGIWEAAVLYYHGASSQTFSPVASFGSIFAGQIGWIPSEFIWFIIVAVGFWFILQRRSIGNHIFAVGGNRAAAAASGVRVNKTKLIAFTLAGGCAAFAGILAATRVGNVSPTNGSELPLNAIAAAVVGGLILTGGVGTVLGMVLGAALLYWIQDVLLLLGAPGFYLTGFVGALVILAAYSFEALRRAQS